MCGGTISPPDDLAKPLPEQERGGHGNGPALPSSTACHFQGSIKWRIAVHVHHSETTPTLSMEEDLEFAKGRQIALDGTECLKRKGTIQIENVEKRIKEERRERSNTYVSKIPMMVWMHQTRKILILLKQMIGCIGMIHSMQKTLMMNLYPISYQVIKLLLIWDS
ncbi:uncharacterized protein LOC110430863 [Sorghum bicolor]|uniref:uncharacterized protein LOC110430863 n=1 Tax=Sorghum bicolor TaxID=4558 RepID=UPI000B425136|nr:uncharacterized protein LOC110430863 [Sorghum bicolor]|eukprot:XP_021304657.1 uncharacterized protein LOC110430863 [Sorghum bicolor]